VDTFATTSMRMNFFSEMSISTRELSFHRLTLSLLLWSLSSSSIYLSVSAGSAVPCKTDAECKALIPDTFPSSNDGDPVMLLSKGSVCNLGSGHCTNPFERGCLYNRLPGWKRKRVCNSDDADDAEALGLCQAPEFEDYMEVRMTGGNWETAFFNAWLLQILLSEVLGVPTTLEPGLPNTRINYYDTTGAVDYGKIQNIQSFENAHEYKDCRLLREHNNNLVDGTDAVYKPCLNFIPEFWSSTSPWVIDSINRGTMEPPDALGVLARTTL
jgi:hypothetical protein